MLKQTLLHILDFSESRDITITWPIQ